MRDHSASDDDYRGQIRLPATLAARVKEAAKADHRSMNSFLIVLLERSLPENEKADTETAPA